MDAISLPSLHNTDLIPNDKSAIQRALLDIEQLMSMLNDDLGQSTITNVTITDDQNRRLIEQLRQRIYQLEYERNVLLTSYQSLIKLLK